MLYDWTEDRFECIQYMIENSTHEWHELNRLPDAMLTDMVRFDLDPVEFEEEYWRQEAKNHPFA